MKLSRPRRNTPCSRCNQHWAVLQSFLALSYPVYLYASCSRIRRKSGYALVDQIRRCKSIVVFFVKGMNFFLTVQFPYFKNTVLPIFSKAQSTDSCDRSEYPEALDSHFCSNFNRRCYHTDGRPMALRNLRRRAGARAPAGCGTPRAARKFLSGPTGDRVVSIIREHVGIRI